MDDCKDTPCFYAIILNDSRTYCIHGRVPYPLPIMTTTVLTEKYA